jgi:hypothetical protein
MAERELIELYKSKGETALAIDKPSVSLPDSKI